MKATKRMRNNYYYYDTDRPKHIDYAVSYEYSITLEIAVVD